MDGTSSMRTYRCRPSRSFLLATLCFLLPALTTLAVLAHRTSTVVGPLGTLSTTTSGESVQILNMLKVHRGLPLYDRADEPPYYPTTLYNAGFYTAYAWMTSWLPEEILDQTRGARLFTLALASLGLTATLAYGLCDLRRRLPVGETLTSNVAPAMVFVAVATIFGGLPGWWVLSIRPDVGGAAFGAVGLVLVLMIGPRRELAAGLAAGTTLAIAWSFKQSCLLVFGGLVLAGLYQRRWRFLVGLMPPVVSMIAGMQLLLGPEYRYNTVLATSLAGFNVHNIIYLSGHLAVKGILPLTVVALTLSMMRGTRWLRRDESIALTMCAVSTLFGGLAACYRNGSAMNYFFEFNAVAGVLSVVLARQLVETTMWTAPSARRVLVGAALVGAVFLTIAQDVARLADPERFDLVQARFQNVDRREELARARELLLQADGPVYCQPALSGLALDLPFPVYNFVDEPFFHRPAAAKGLLKGPGVQGQIAAHHFQVIVVEGGNMVLADIVREAGYIEHPEMSRLHVFVSPESPLMTALR